MGDVFPEIRDKQQHVEEVIKSEEEAFNKTLDRGIEELILRSRSPLHQKAPPRDYRSPKTSSPVTLRLSSTTPTAFRSTSLS